MTIEQLIRELLEKHSMSQAQLSRSLGITPQALTARLKSKNMGIESIIEIMDILQYEVVVQPKGKKASGQHLLEKGEEK